MTWGCGKVILLGEHAVVYGHPALAGALARGVKCAACPSSCGGTELEIHPGVLAVKPGDDHPVARALAALLDALDMDEPALRIEARFSVPPAAGLGSSAALSVAVTRLLVANGGRRLAPAALEEVANKAERQFHSRPSGIDVALAARGGLGLFCRGAPLRALDVEPVPLVVGLSGQPRHTATMVERVAAARARRASAVDSLLAALGTAATDGVEAVSSRDWPSLGHLMNQSQAILADLGVSTPVLDTLCEAARHAGAQGAKLTGAGGGGAVIALAPGREQAVLAAWRTLGYDGFACAAGVRCGQEDSPRS